MSMFPSIQPLPFKPKMITGISEKLIASHYEKNYGGAARRLLAISQELRRNIEDQVGYMLNGLKREELIAANSVLLHEAYFDSLGGNSNLEDISEALMKAIHDHFGSFEIWKKNFAQMGKALAGGSGWVLLIWSPRWKALKNIWAADHTHCLVNGRILLALDMYEHAYHMDYGADAAAYVDCFMKNLDWQIGRASCRERVL